MKECRRIESSTYLHSEIASENNHGTPDPNP